MKKRFIKLLPTILSGIIYGILWYFLPGTHPFIIAIIWIDLRLIDKKVLTLPQ